MLRARCWNPSCPVSINPLFGTVCFVWREVVWQEDVLDDGFIRKSPEDDPVPAKVMTLCSLTHWTRRHLFFYWLPLKFHSPLFPRGHLPDFVMRYKVGGKNGFISVAYITHLYSLTIRNASCHTEHRTSQSTENWIVLYVCVCLSVAEKHGTDMLCYDNVIIERKKGLSSKNTNLEPARSSFQSSTNKFEQSTSSLNKQRTAVRKTLNHRLKMNCRLTSTFLRGHSYECVQFTWADHVKREGGHGVMSVTMKRL